MSWDKKDIEYKTNSNLIMVKKYKEKVYNYEKDINQGKRIKSLLCKCCYYFRNDTIAFQAFTDKDCKKCGKKMTFPSSNTDELCIECACELNTCIHCGAELD